ncbi:hypothetical protein D3C74_51410 [compost metagenome]
MRSAAYVGSEISEFVIRNYVQWERRGSTGQVLGEREMDGTVNAQVNSGSSILFINGNRAARLGDTTYETVDSERPEGSGWDRLTPYSGRGTITGGVSGKVFIEGIPLALVNSTVSTHVGEEKPLISGSNTFFVSS